MQVCSWELKHRQATVGWIESEALVARQDHTAGPYWNPGWSWFLVTDHRQKKSAYYMLETMKNVSVKDTQ